MLERFKQEARKLKRETLVLYLVYKDPRVARWKRLFLALVIGYALSPIDLVPDFIPVLGYLDDLVLVPLGIRIALKLIPPEIIAECRKKVMEQNESTIPVGKKTALVIVLFWAIGLLLIMMWSISLIEVLFQ